MIYRFKCLDEGKQTGFQQGDSVFKRVFRNQFHNKLVVLDPLLFTKQLTFYILSAIIFPKLFPLASSKN